MAHNDHIALAKKDTRCVMPDLIWHEWSSPIVLPKNTYRDTRLITPNQGDCR